MRVSGLICGSIVVISRRKTRPGKASALTLTRWPTCDLRALSPRQGEIYVERRQIGQGHDRRAWGQVLPDFDLPHAELAGERCADQLLRDQRLGLGDLRAGLVELALLLVDGFPRLEVALGELGRALQCGLRPSAPAPRNSQDRLRSGASLSWTSGSPAFTVVPGSKKILTTRPPISGLIVTWCTAASEPMAGAKRGTASVLTSTALICAGGGLLVAK